MKRVVIATALVASIGLATGQASAQTPEITEERQMTLPAGRAFVQGFVEMNLSDEAVLEPFSLAPDLWYGVSNVMTAGLVHSGRATTGFFGGSGNGLCLAGEEGGCGKVYDNIGLDARYHFHRNGGITSSAVGGLLARSFDPFQLALKIGLVGRWQSGDLALEFAPSLVVGLTEREPEVVTGTEVAATNKETLNLPVTAIYGLSPRLGLALQTGAVVPFEATDDTYTIALSIGAQYWLTESVFADLAFSLPALAGGPEDTGTDRRTLTIGVGYAL